MITHDVGEAVLLADRIMLMTNDPDAQVVVNILPKARIRASLHQQHDYHALSDHILEFLLTRSRALAGTRPAYWDPKAPPKVQPALEEIPA